MSKDDKIVFEGRGGHKIASNLNDSIDYLKSLLLKVIAEYDPKIASNVETLLEKVTKARNDNSVESFTAAEDFINTLSVDEAQKITRSLTCFFHLANLAEEKYRVEQLSSFEGSDEFLESGDDLNIAYNQLIDEVGEEDAKRRLHNLTFNPVLTAHPTEARRKAVSGKIIRIGKLLTKIDRAEGVSKIELERRILDEIDAIFRTSPIALQKPTPVEESDTVISTVNETMFDVVPKVMRRFDDLVKLHQKDNADNKLELEIGVLEPVPMPFFELGSWIGSDRDGNPNVVSTVTRTVADKYSNFIVNKLAERVTLIGRNMTLESELTPASDNLKKLWVVLKNLDDRKAEHIEFISKSEPHRSSLLLIGKRLEATAERNMDYGYKSPEDLLADLKVVQESLLSANANRSAYGLLQTLIWQVEIFGFHLASMEVRQHSQVHEAALKDLVEKGVDSDDLEPMTKEVVNTFQAIGAIQRKFGVKAVHRYIISFTQQASHISDVFALAQLSEPIADNVATLDVIPLFETMEDLENSVDILEQMIKLPQVQARLKQTGNKIEVMLGYSDSSKDVGPVAATFALHSAQDRISKWAKSHGLNLVLFHGRGGALGRGGGPAHRAVISQPPGSVNGTFKITEQGESITARYSNPKLAVRHIETILGATLLNSAPSVEEKNAKLYEKNAGLVEGLVKYSKDAFLDLVQSDDFANWFATVTPLEEVGLLPIGSRPAKRGLSTRSLEDLRAIPWVFAWAQARINLAAWYGFGSACQGYVENAQDREKALDSLREAYSTWNLFSTLVDNIEMAVSKTDERIAAQYLSLSDREDLSQKVLDELKLTVKWILEINQSSYPLEKKKVLGQAIQIRGPYVDALSELQFKALRNLRKNRDKYTQEQLDDIQYLLLCTVSGVSAGLQNTG
jgi:phosphoenolpyruvate carboxylase